MGCGVLWAHGRAVVHGRTWAWAGTRHGCFPGYNEMDPGRVENWRASCRWRVSTRILSICAVGSHAFIPI
jgi:hypothetical protein